LLQVAMGLGMVIWLLEDERDELARTSEALHRSEERLRRSQRLEAVGRLAGGIAHDFNNLLTVISGRGQRLLGRLPAGSEDWEEVQQIEGAAERGASLVRQLLAFSRRQVLAPQTVRANGLVRNVHSMLQRSIGEEIDFRCELAPDLGWARDKDLEAVYYTNTKFKHFNLPGWKGLGTAYPETIIYESAKISGVFQELNITTIKRIASIYKGLEMYSKFSQSQLDQLLAINSETKVIDVYRLIELIKFDMLNFEKALLNELKLSVKELKEIKENNNFTK
jgi:hypothetical protein